MGRKALGYGAGLIALYLFVANGTKAGALLKDGATGGRSIIATFQGR